MGRRRSLMEARSQQARLSRLQGCRPDRQALAQHVDGLVDAGRGGLGAHAPPSSSTTAWARAGRGSDRSATTLSVTWTEVTPRAAESAFQTARSAAARSWAETSPEVRNRISGLSRVAFMWSPRCEVVIAHRKRGGCGRPLNGETSRASTITPEPDESFVTRPPPGRRAPGMFTIVRDHRQSRVIRPPAKCPVRIGRGHCRRTADNSRTNGDPEGREMTVRPTLL